MFKDSPPCSGMLVGHLGPPPLPLFTVSALLNLLAGAHQAIAPTKATLASLHHSRAWALSFSGVSIPRLRARQGQEMAFHPIFVEPNAAASTEKAASEH